MNDKVNRLIITYKYAPPTLVIIESTLDESQPRNLDLIGLPYVLYHWTNSFNFCANCGSRGHFRTQCSLILNQRLI